MKTYLNGILTFCSLLLPSRSWRDADIKTVFLVSNHTEDSTILDPLMASLHTENVRMDTTVWVLGTLQPFVTLSTVDLQGQSVELVLISPHLCEALTSTYWLQGLSIPYICVTESNTAWTNRVIVMYTITCLNNGFVDSLKDCYDTVQSQPSIENILGTLVDGLHWNTITIFFEDKMDKLASSVSEALSRQRVQTLMYRVDEHLHDEGISSLIEHAINLLSVDERNFLLLCDGSHSKRFLEKADGFSDRATAMRMMSSWLLILPFSEFQALHYTNINLDNVATVLTSSVVFPLETAPQEDCYRTMVTTLLHKPGSRQWNTVAHVNADGRVEYQGDIFPNRHFGFNKRKLLVATILWAPFSMKHTNDSHVIYEGICMDLLHELARTFNFTYTVREPDDGEFGRVLNGSWTGVVGLLERQEVDMAVAPLTVTQERETVMDFIYPYYYDAGAALYKLPDKTSSKWLTLLKPFSKEVFFCIGVVFLSTCFLLSSMEYVTISEKRRQQNKTTSMQEVLSVCMWHILGTFLKHGSRKRLQSRPGRILISFVWLFCIIVVAAYSGNLIAFLTVTKNNPPFRTLSDVVQQEEYTWGTDGGSMWTTLFKTSNRSDYQRIWKGIVNHNKTNPGVLSLSPDLHREAVEDGSYLFFFDRDVIAVWAQDNCDLVLLEETFYQITYAVGLPQNSPYGRMLSEKMLKIEQSGLLQIWKRNWWPKGSSCAAELQVQAKVIELIDLQSAFYMLGIGFGLAILVLLIERVRRCCI